MKVVLARNRTPTANSRSSSLPVTRKGIFFTALLCRLAFREKMGAGKTAALLLATAGIVCFCDPSGGFDRRGILLAVASAVTYSCYMTGMDKTALRKDKAAVDAELTRLRRLIDLGGFIPCPDHRLMPGTKFELVQYYCELMQNL